MSTTSFVIALLAGVAVPLAALSNPLDLDGDTDRTGAIEGTSGEEASEERASVIVLNNCDDDDEDGRADNRDIRLNGERDQDDLEPILLRRAGAPLEGPVYLELVNPPGERLPASRKIRIFSSLSGIASRVIAV